MRLNQSHFTNLCNFKLISTRAWVEISLWFFVVFKVFYFHFVVKNGHCITCVSGRCRNSAKQPGAQQSGEGWALIRSNFRKRNKIQEELRNTRALKYWPYLPDLYLIAVANQTKSQGHVRAFLLFFAKHWRSWLNQTVWSGHWLFKLQTCRSVKDKSGKMFHRYSRR